MKPSQFIYSESIRSQKAERAEKPKIIKSIGGLRPIPKTAKDCNSSVIYSLVNFAIKEGQNETLFFPQSLIPSSFNVRPEIMVMKNTELARDLKKLKPLQNLDSEQEQTKQNNQGIIQKAQVSKQQAYLKSLNQLKNGLFKRTQTHLIFGSIEPKVFHNTILCLVRIQKLKFFNEYNPRNDKIPPLFCWEAIYQQKSLIKTIPKNFDSAQEDLLDFLFTRQDQETIEILLWKVKNNDENYVGHFEIFEEDFYNHREVLNFRKKIITDKFIEKEMFKSFKQTKSFIGDVQFQLIQFGNQKFSKNNLIFDLPKYESIHVDDNLEVQQPKSEENEPRNAVPQIQIKSKQSRDQFFENQHFAIPGSPRTEKERRRHKIIDQAKAGQEYDWNLDDNEKIVIERINLIKKTNTSESNTSLVYSEWLNINCLMQTRYENLEEYGRSRVIDRRFRKEIVDAHINLLKKLDKNGLFTETQAMIRQQSRLRRVTKKLIEEALLNVGCTANQLLLTECDEFGDCLMEFFLNTDDLGAVLEAISVLNFFGEDEQNLEVLSKNLFKIIAQYFRRNKNLKAAIEFIKSLLGKPEVGILIYNYSYSIENMNSKIPPFLLHFDQRNYEHIMVFGKLKKLIDNILTRTKFTQTLIKAYFDSKRQMYFEIPCFPKKKNLQNKYYYLQLEELGQNIMHEIVRRQKWKKMHLIFESHPEWFFVTDKINNTPFDRILETAPYDVLQTLISAYPDQLDRIIKQFNPNENLSDIRIIVEYEDESLRRVRKKERKRKPYRIWKMQKEYRKNFLHRLFFNKNLTQNYENLLNVITLINNLVNLYKENNFEILKTQKLRANNFQPVSFFLALLKTLYKKNLTQFQEIINISLNICQILMPISDFWRCDEQSKLNFSWDYDSQYAVALNLCKFSEEYFIQFEELFNFIEWIPKLEKLKVIRYVGLPIRFLIKNKQQQKLSAMISFMQNELNEISYDPKNLNSDENLKIIYYLQILFIMLLDIENLKSQKLDQIAVEIFSVITDACQKFTELLVVDMPQNLMKSYYPMTIQIIEMNQKNKKQKEKKIEINNLLQMINFASIEIILIPQTQRQNERQSTVNKSFEILLQDIDRLNLKLLVSTLNTLCEPQIFKDFFKFVLDKDQWRASKDASKLYDKEYYNLIVYPEVLDNDPNNVYKDLLTQQQAEQMLEKRKGDILKLVFTRSKFSDKVHNLILTSLFNNKPIGITQQQLALWLRVNYEKISFRYKKLYFNFFRQNCSFQQIHLLIDLEFKSEKRQYYKQTKIYPYVQAQGKNWASILQVKKFAVALKDNINYINLEQTVKTISVNGQYEKLKIILPYIKDAQLIQQTIHLVSFIADLQLFNQKEYYDQRNYFKSDVKGEEIQNENLGNNSAKLSNKKISLQKQQLLKNKQQQRIQLIQRDQQLAALQEIKVRCFDPAAFFFKTSIKDKKEKNLIDTPKFPEVLDQLRIPISIQVQLEEMQQGFQTEMNEFITISWPKYGKISLKKFEVFLEKDVQAFRYLKNWKQALTKQNVGSIFTQYDQGSDSQSYSKVLNLLLKQFSRNNIPLCEQAIEYKRTLGILMIYGLMTIEQVCSYVNSSQLPEDIKAEIFVNLLKQIINPGKGKLALHYYFANLGSYIQSVNHIIKKINLKILNQSIDVFKDEILLPLKKALIPQNNEKGTLNFKLACEVIQKFDYNNLKELFSEQLNAIGKQIKRTIKDKQLLQLAKKYISENNENSIQKVKLNYKDVIKSFKKKKLEEALQYDIINYLKQYSDLQCVEIITKLFKLPYEQTYRDDLLQKFNENLFEALIFNRKHKTYNLLIHEVLFKKILKEDIDEFSAIFKNHIEIQEQDYDSDEEKKEWQLYEENRRHKFWLAFRNKFKREQYKREENKNNRFWMPINYKKTHTIEVQNIPKQAAQFCFYEYFDSLHRCRLKIKDFNIWNYQRFQMNDNQTLSQLSLQFEQQGLIYISNCLKLFKFLRENNPQENFMENSIFLAFVSESEKHLEKKSLKFIKFYKEIGDGPEQFFINKVFSLKNSEDDIFRLMLSSIDQGVKFCFASDFGNQKDEYTNKYKEYHITEEDVNQTNTQTFRFPFNEYLENCKTNEKVRIGLQTLMNQELISPLNELIYQKEQQELLIDKIELSEQFKRLFYNDSTFEFLLANFPYFWYDERFIAESFQQFKWFENFNLGLIQFKSILLFEPQYIGWILQLYFEALFKYQEIGIDWNKYLKNEYDYYENYNKTEEKKQRYQESLYAVPSEGEWEEYEVEGKDDQNQNSIPSQSLNDKEKLQISDKPDQNQENQKKSYEQNVKPNKKERRKKLFIESGGSLRKQLFSNCQSQIYFQIFLQLFLLATTNEELFKLIQKSLIQYRALGPLYKPREIDEKIKNRLIDEGFKEPFDMQFVEAQEKRANELQQQQIQDISNIKEVLIYNQNTINEEESAMYQFLISTIFQCQYDNFQIYIENLIENPTYKLLQKNQKQLEKYSLEEDQRFLSEVRLYFSQTEKLEFTTDVISTFFDNFKSLPQTQTNDKWIHILYFLNYCKQVLKQIKLLQNQIQRLRKKVKNSDKPSADHFQQYQKQVQRVVQVESSYKYGFKLSNNIEPLICEHIKEVTEKQIENQKILQINHFFQFELIFNIQHRKTNQISVPIVQFSQKYQKEIIKAEDIINFEEYVFHIEEISSTKKGYASQLSSFDEIDFTQIKGKLNRQNYKCIMYSHYIQNFHLEESISKLKAKLETDTLQKLLKALVESESKNQLKVKDKIWNLFNSANKSEIKIILEGKPYTVPQSNYQARQRYSKYQQSLEADLAFPELYPLVILDVYLYVPDILTQEEFNVKYEPLEMLQQVCLQLYSYSKALDQVTKLQSSDALAKYFETKKDSPQIVQWPLTYSKHKKFKDKKIVDYDRFQSFQYAHPLRIIYYLFKKIKLQIDHKIQFTYNVLSLTEILLFNITKFVQQTTGKKCQLSTAISLLQDWSILHKVLQRIGDILITNQIDQFSFYYVEVEETQENSVFQIKSIKLEGLDQTFRFGQTQFFVHSNVLIIRLNLAVISYNLNSLIDQKINFKLRNYEGTRQLFFQENDIIDYLEFIVTKESMLKQIFHKA